jgi:hypothetical protein
MKPGSWVVCVDDSNWAPIAYQLFNALPKRGQIYRVRRLIDDMDGKFGAEPGIALEGIWGDLFFHQTESGLFLLEEYHFFMHRFREVDPPLWEAVDAGTLLDEISVN